MANSSSTTPSTEGVLKKDHNHVGKFYPKGTPLSDLGKIAKDDLERMKKTGIN